MTSVAIMDELSRDTKDRDNKIEFISGMEENTDDITAEHYGIKKEITHGVAEENIIFIKN